MSSTHSQKEAVLVHYIRAWGEVAIEVFFAYTELHLTLIFLMTIIIYFYERSLSSVEVIYVIAICNFAISNILTDFFS